MNSLPSYTHTISLAETTFIGNADEKDYYYRTGIFTSIDIRHSNEPSDYTTWSLKHLEETYKVAPNYIDNIVPVEILEKARMIKNTEEAAHTKKEKE